MIPGMANPIHTHRFCGTLAPVRPRFPSPGH